MKSFRNNLFCGPCIWGEFGWIVRFYALLALSNLRVMLFPLTAKLCKYRFKRIELFAKSNDCGHAARSRVLLCFASCFVGLLAKI